MFSFEEALRSVLEKAQLLPIESVSLQEARGHFLAEAIAAPFTSPRFDNSAVDGYAVKLRDVESASEKSPARLRLLGTVRAGADSAHEITFGSTLRVLTGAPLPASAEAVVMKEDAEEQDGWVMIRRRAQRDENVRHAGAEFQANQVALAAGTHVTPPVIGLIASFGLSTVMVHRKPKVALIITGDELAPPSVQLQAGQIYDSNSAGLSTALRALPIELVFLALTADDLISLQRDISLALTRADVIITVGGASVGAFDFVQEALALCGTQLHFTSVAMKPGKPTVFASVESANSEQLIFGLPGNPVSALVTFHLFVRPALLKMLGAPEPLSAHFTATLGSALQKKPGRLEFVRAKLIHENGGVMAYPTLGQESHMLGGLAAADALIHFPAELTKLPAGIPVVVERLAW